MKEFPLWILSAPTLRAMLEDCRKEIMSGLSVALSNDAKWIIEQIQSELDARDEAVREMGAG